MMRLACLSLSYSRTFQQGRMNVWSFIDECRRLNLDGVDLNTANAFKSDDPAHLHEIKRRCLDRGLDIPCVSISNNFGQAPQALPAEIEMTKKWIRAAAYLGAPIVRVFAGNPPTEADRPAAWSRAVAASRQVAEFAQPLGVVVALQNHNHAALTRTGDDVLRFLREVDHPNYSHILDTGQYAGSPGASGKTPDELKGTDFYRSISLTAPKALFVRAKLYHVETGKETSLDYDRIFTTLRHVGFNGWVSLVYEGTEENVIAVEKGAAFLRRYLLAQ